MKKIVLCILTVMFLSACATVPSNVNTLARLQNEKVIDGSNKHSFMFRKVDGDKLKIGAFTTPNKATHYVSPGNHTLNIEVTHHYDGADVVWASKFNVDVLLEAGETYTVKAFEEGWCINMKVVNSQGVVVAGPKVSILSPFLSLNHMQNAGLMARVKQKIESAKCVDS